jgi:methionyl-tRNA formyltransferase
MFRIATPYVRTLVHSPTRARLFHSSLSLQNEEKLRILFCGADRFSVTHLEALHDESKLSNSNIASISVVTKTDKRTGRGLKQITSPPVKTEAVKLGLPVQQIDTFTGWTPPPTDLVVAVSFGLLVPARILEASKYGGINVHPSLLPDLRGAAPVHWAIMLGRKHTGVTIQSLHPTKFDEGVIIDQTPSPGIPVNHKWGGLNDTLAAFGAAMLVNVIREGLYVPPYKPVTPRNFDEIALAPKIASEHRQIDFSALTADDILRRFAALHVLTALALTKDGRRLRVILGPKVDEFASRDAEVRSICKWQPIGQPYAIADASGGSLGPAGAVFVNTIDGRTLCIEGMTVEGHSPAASLYAAKKAHLISSFRIQHQGVHAYSIAWFHSPLSTLEDHRG